jgi:uncharacterized protein (TIGR03437 family)
LRQLPVLFGFAGDHEVTCLRLVDTRLPQQSPWTINFGGAAVKKTIALSFLLTSFAVAPLSAQTVRGRLLDAVSNAPLADAELELTVNCVSSSLPPMGLSQTAKSQSLADGTFNLTGGAPPGCPPRPLLANFSIKKPGYFFRHIYEDLSVGGIYDLGDVYGTNLPRLTTVNAASYLGVEALGTPDTIGAAFGTNLAETTVSATALPLPTVLAGRRLTVRDRNGLEKEAQLLFVSPTQINWIVPAGLTVVNLIVKVYADDRVIAVSFNRWTRPTAGIFSANASGQGVPAAIVTRVKPGNLQTIEPVARYDDDQKQFVAVPIVFGPEDEQLVLSLFGTGWRSIPQQNFTITVGSEAATVTYAGWQPTLPGLDQINLLLPRSLKDRGAAIVQVRYLESSGTGVVIPLNPVTINLR